jgi:hypothetical protein
MWTTRLYAGAVYSATTSLAANRLARADTRAGRNAMSASASILAACLAITSMVSATMRLTFYCFMPQPCAARDDDDFVTQIIDRTIGELRLVLSTVLSESFYGRAEVLQTSNSKPENITLHHICVNSTQTLFAAYLMQTPFDLLDNKWPQINRSRHDQQPFRKGLVHYPRCLNRGAGVRAVRLDSQTNPIYSRSGIGWRVEIASRFQTLIVEIAMSNCTSSTSLKFALASPHIPSGTPACAIRVTASVKASAARSLSVYKSSASGQAARRLSRLLVSPCSVASRLCMSRQNAQPFNWEARILIKLRRLFSKMPERTYSSMAKTAVYAGGSTLCTTKRRVPVIISP